VKSGARDPTLPEDTPAHSPAGPAMRVFAYLPIVFLVVLGLLAWIALRTDVPLNFPFIEPPARAPLPEPELELGEAVLEGRLVGGERETPLEQALVSVMDGPRLLWTFTDEEGRFRLEQMAPGECEVSVLARDYPPAVRSVVAGSGPVVLHLPARHGEPPLVRDIERSDLVGTVSVPGEASGLGGFELAFLPDREPNLPGASVPVRLRLDASGGFVARELAHGTYRVLLLPDWARGGSWPDLLAASGGEPFIVVHPRAQSAEPLALPARSGVIRGVVTERHDTPGAAGVRVGFVEGAMVIVQALAAERAPPASVRVWPPAMTDVTGAFEIRHLPPGRYRLIVRSGAGRIEQAVTVRPQSIITVDLPTLGER